MKKRYFVNEKGVRCEYSYLELKFATLPEEERARSLNQTIVYVENLIKSGELTEIDKDGNVICCRNCRFYIPEKHLCFIPKEADTKYGLSEMKATEPDRCCHKHQKAEPVTRAFRVYGKDGYNQWEAGNKSWKSDWTNPHQGIRIVGCLNSDRTGHDDYAVVVICRDDADSCLRELNGQITDGIFENCAFGAVEEVPFESVKGLWDKLPFGR